MIAVDAMGGDSAPHTTVGGAVLAAQQGISVTLFGDELSIQAALNTTSAAWSTLPISIIHCTQTIGMGESPSRALVTKKDSSLVAAVNAVAHGRADAVVSAGNTGASLIAGSLLLQRLAGIARPALCSSLPTKEGAVLCLDLGANVDTKPEVMVQHAVLANAYLKLTTQIASPKIGLLANGHEPGKGTALIRKAHELLDDTDLNFVGNVEPKHVIDGYVDILLTDGFSGNIMLKTMEATASAIQHWLKRGICSSWLDMLLFKLRSRVFDVLRDKVDYARIGGALLLGLKHPMIVAHGNSTPTAIAQAIQYADDVAKMGLISHLAQTVNGPFGRQFRPVGISGRKV